MATALTAAGPLALPTMNTITEQLETGAQLTDARSREKNCLEILDALPPELVNQVFNYLDVPDRLVLRLLCRKTHASISRPGLLHKHEIGRVAQLLKRDRFLKACQIYREYPDPRVLPCARCMMVHPMEMFFDAQIEQRHEERSCKAEGIITACPCSPTTWDTLLSAISARRAHGIWYNSMHCTCSPKSIKLAYTSVGRYLPRFTWATPSFRKEMPSERRGCVPPRPYTAKAFRRGQRIGTGLLLDQTYEWSGLNEAALLSDLGLAASTLREAAFPICPHVSTKDDIVIAMLHKFKPNKWVAGVHTSKGACDVKDCKTRFYLQFSENDELTLGHCGFLEVVKDLGRVHQQAGPLSNKVFLAQAIMPSGTTSRCNGDGDADYIDAC